MPGPPIPGLPEQTSLATGETKLPHCRLSVVVIGVHRLDALGAAAALDPLRPNYRVVSCLDYTESPEPLRFSPHNLAVVLNSLHPRPKALVTGTAVSNATLKEIEPIWKRHVREAIELENLGGSRWVQVDFFQLILGRVQLTLFSKLSKWHATPDGPPPEGTVEELVRQLDETFL